MENASNIADTLLRRLTIRPQKVLKLIYLNNPKAPTPLQKIVVAFTNGVITQEQARQQIISWKISNAK